jgi:hypothetical protein
VERISINDEDRQRQGFELQTTYRFLPGPEGRIQLQTSLVLDVESKDESPLASLKYAPAAQIWRINRGWRRRKNKEQLGFYINPITGSGASKDEPVPPKTRASRRRIARQGAQPAHRALRRRSPQRTDPRAQYKPLKLEAMATLQAALKRGIELVFQIEESELVAEPLPKPTSARRLLFYEAAEGGAGVLTRLATEPDAWH